MHETEIFSTNYFRNEEEGEELVVGWPPIQSWRKKLLLHGQHPQQGQVGRRVSKFVKVKMEGVGIARKINLSLYNSFETLANSLIHMFATCKCIYSSLIFSQNGPWCTIRVLVLVLIFCLNTEQTRKVRNEVYDIR